MVGWWWWLVVATVLILLSSLHSFSHPCLHPPHKHTQAALGSTFARALKNHQFCLLRAKAFCGFFDIKGGGEEERIACGAGAARGD